MKKKVLGLVIKQLMEDFASDISPEDQTSAENDIGIRMRSLLGEDWATLPITGPYMMISVLIMNIVLVPYGITPKKISESAISKGKEYGLDTRFNELMESARETAQATGEFTAEKLKEMSEYSSEKGKDLASNLKIMLDESAKTAKDLLDKGITKSKGMFQSLKKQLQKNEDTEETEETDNYEN